MIGGRLLSDSRYQLDSLDGLRGMAALLVFLSHTSNGGTLLLPFANFYAAGKSGVFLFFTLSAFLLTYPFVRQGAEASKRKFLLNYSLRRFLRIYPLYFVYLLMALGTTVIPWKSLASWMPKGIPFSLSFEEFAHSLLLQDAKGVAWSIVVEFHYYFLLPIVGLTYSRLLKNNVLAASLLTLGLIVLCQMIWPASELALNDQRLGPYLPIFLMGSLAAVYHHRWQTRPETLTRGVSKAIEAAGLAAILALIFLIPSVASRVLGANAVFFGHHNFHKDIVLFGALWSVVLLACLAGAGTLRRFFELKALRYLGFISFSVYLWHVVVLRVVGKAVPDLPLKGWLMLLVTVGVSHLSWSLVEKPMSRLSLGKPRDKALPSPAYS